MIYLFEHKDGAKLTLSAETVHQALKLLDTLVLHEDEWTLEDQEEEDAP